MRTIKVPPTTHKNDVKLRRVLLEHNIEESKMPVKPATVSTYTKITTALYCLLALTILGVYVGIPILQAVHTKLPSIRQGVVIASAVIIQIGLLALLVVAKTAQRTTSYEK
jgi:hypothetical protein